MRDILNARIILGNCLLIFGCIVSGYIGSLAAKVSALEQTIGSLSGRNRIVQSECVQRLQALELLVASETARLNELQEWRITITLASRKGWGAANRYIARQWEFMPEEWRYAERDTGSDK